MLPPAAGVISATSGWAIQISAGYDYPAYVSMLVY
jgi:hypothetical protein